MERYIRKEETEASRLDEDWIILQTEQFTVTTLNEAGGYCWELLAEAQSSHSLAEAVKAKYGEAAVEDEAEMEGFLYELMRCGLIQYAG